MSFQIDSPDRSFKTINDQLGHDSGDRALVFLAQTLVKVFRKNKDKLIRLGGDEFALALPLNHGPEEIRAVFDRLLSLIPRIGDEVSNHMVAISAR